MLIALFIAIAAAIAATIAVAMHLPALGVAQVSPGSDRVRLVRPSDPPGAYRILALRSSNGGEQVRGIGADDFIAWDRDPPTPAQLDRQAALARIAASGPVVLDLASADGPRRVSRTVARIGWAPMMAVILLVPALAACAGVGAWIIALRPSRLSTVTVALSGFALLLAGLPLIVPLTGEWIFGRGVIVAVFHVNSLASQLFAAALLGLFARHPMPVIGRRATNVMMALPALVGALALAAPDLPSSVGFVNACVVVEALAIVGLVLCQWRASARDLRARAFVRWIGAAALLSVVAFVGLYHLPITFGFPPFIDTAGQILVFVPFYLALVFGIVRFRALDLDSWSVTVLRYAMLALLLGATDAALMFALNLAPNRAALLAISVALTVWLVVRDRLRRRLLRDGPRERQDLLRLAVQVVLVRDAATRAEHWSATLQRLFEPLDVAPAGGAVPRPRIDEDGLALSMPAVAGSVPLQLRHARGGTSLFRADDLRIAEEFASLCAAVDEDRDAYDRGVREERDRIARDLHDDVGARLLSSLHRTEPDAVRGDVRAALADMRVIVGGLIGERVALGTCLAALRQESAERVGAAGLALDWPIDRIAADPLLDYAVAKNLASAIRELITNAIRHAGASAIGVDVDLRQGSLTVAVADDGCGLHLAPDDRTNGLANVAERLARHGGHLRIDAPARGARFVLTLPIGPP